MASKDSVVGTGEEPLVVHMRRARGQRDVAEVLRMWKDIMDEEIYYPYDRETYSRETIEAEWIDPNKYAIYLAHKTSSSVPSEDNNKDVVVASKQISQDSANTFAMQPTW